MRRAVLRRKRGEADAKTEYDGKADKKKNIVPVSSVRRQEGHRVKSVLRVRSEAILCGSECGKKDLKKRFFRLLQRCCFARANPREPALMAATES